MVAEKHTTYNTYERRKTITKTSFKKWYSLHENSLLFFFVIISITILFLANINTTPDPKLELNQITLEDNSFVKIKIQGVIKKNGSFLIQIPNIPDGTIINIALIPKYHSGIKNFEDAKLITDMTYRFSPSSWSYQINIESRKSIEMAIDITSLSPGEEITIETTIQNQSFIVRHENLLTNSYFQVGTLIQILFWGYLVHHFIFSKSLLWKDIRLGFLTLIRRGPRIRPSEVKSNSYEEVREKSLDYIFGLNE